jgi:hypothetical protein
LHRKTRHFAGKTQGLVTIKAHQITHQSPLLLTIKAHQITHQSPLLLTIKAHQITHQSPLLLTIKAHQLGTGAKYWSLQVIVKRGTHSGSSAMLLLTIKAHYP